MGGGHERDGLRTGAGRGVPGRPRVGEDSGGGSGRGGLALVAADGREGDVAEAIGRMVDRTREAALGREIGCEGCQGFGVITGIVCELDGDRFRRAFRNRVVQVFDRSLRFDPLVEANESDTF